MSKETEEFLEHYGVPGMKWGVRRAGRSIISRKAKSKVTPRPSDEGRAALKILDKQKKYGTVSLTNHELRIVNARIKLEQEFVKAFPPPPNKLKRGEEIAKKIISVYEMTDKVANLNFKNLERKDKIKKIKSGTS